MIGGKQKLILEAPETEISVMSLDSQVWVLWGKPHFSEYNAHVDGTAGLSKSVQRHLETESNKEYNVEKGQFAQIHA